MVTQLESSRTVDPAPTDPAARVGSWSNDRTSDCVLGLLSDLDPATARVCDVGAGPGRFSQIYGETVLGPVGLSPAEHLSACDTDCDSFGYSKVECRTIPPTGRLPFEDGEFDAVVSIEVVEHVEDQFAFMRELARITKPGGRVVVTTPNVLNAASRIRTAASGFPILFNPLPISSKDRRFVLGGHINPISPYFLAYTALSAGLERPSLSADRSKRSAAFAAVLLSPLLWIGRRRLEGRLGRKHPEVLAENRELLAELSGWSMLTARTAVLVAHKPAP